MKSSLVIFLSILSSSVVVAIGFCDDYNSTIEGEVHACTSIYQSTTQGLSHRAQQELNSQYRSTSTTYFVASPLLLPTILTRSSSETTWLNPTLCGICRALAPHTSAYLKLSFSVR